MSFKNLSSLCGRLLLAGIVAALCASLLSAQSTAALKTKPVPTELSKNIVVFADAYVSNYWTHTAALINAPEQLTVVNPGQCIHIGVYAVGDKREPLIAATEVAFHIRFAGRTDEIPMGVFGQTHPVKPEGGDFVTEVLSAANVENPMQSMALLGVSNKSWCVPADAGDGQVTIDGEAATPSGAIKLATAQVKVESWATGSQTAFKSLEEEGNWSAGYYRHPEPARLLPALRLLVADPKTLQSRGALANTIALFAAALKANPAASREFAARVNAEPNPLRTLAVAILQVSGADIQPVIEDWSAQDRARFEGKPQWLDAYAFNPNDGQDATRLDFCWAEFMATGRIEPVRQVVSALAWRPDYDAFDKARKADTLGHEWTPEIGHTVAYMAASWSLDSFNRNDPLAADYLLAIAADPATPTAIKAELKELSTNPAFKNAKK
jgi:hypothetical protein